MYIHPKKQYLSLIYATNQHFYPLKRGEYIAKESLTKIWITFEWDISPKHPLLASYQGTMNYSN